MHLWIWLVLPFSSSCFFSPTVFGLPRPLRMGSDWLLARGLLLFSMSLVRGHSILSLRMRSVLLRLKSSLSKAGITNTTCCLAICSGGCCSDFHPNPCYQKQLCFFVVFSLLFFEQGLQFLTFHSCFHNHTVSVYGQYKELNILYFWASKVFPTNQEANQIVDRKLKMYAMPSDDAAKEKHV